MRDAPPASPAPTPAASGDTDLGGVALAACLTCMAGFVDAVAFLGFGGVFASFMSGNTTRLGVAAAGSRTADLVLYASSVVLFVAGVAAGRAVGGGSPPRRRAVLALAALAGWAGMSAAALIAATLAMGAQNAVIHKAGRTPVTLTYVTGTLVRVGEGLADWLAGRGGEPTPAYVLLWAGLAAGAVAGAFAYSHWGAQALAVPAALAFLLAAAVGGAEPRPEGEQT